MDNKVIKGMYNQGKLGEFCNYNVICFILMEFIKVNKLGKLIDQQINIGRRATCAM